MTNTMTKAKTKMTTMVTKLMAMMIMMLMMIATKEPHKAKANNLRSFAEYGLCQQRLSDARHSFVLSVAPFR